MVKVRIHEINLFGEYLYRMLVNDKYHSHFFSKTPLTYSEQQEIVAGYTDGLTLMAERDRFNETKENNEA